jgi:acyl carrier protein
VRQATLERFGARFAAAGFRTESFRLCYGLAEATLLVSSTRAAEKCSMAAGVAGCGRPLYPQEVIVVDPSTHVPCQAGVTGEIWVSGPNVGLGYWGCPEDTEAVFHKPVEGTTTPAYLRTGDLGVMSDGELFITGRLKDVIILHGRNLHAEDVEAVIHGCHPALVRGGCAAFAASGKEGERLVVVQEVRTSVESELGDSMLAIRRAVAASHQVRTDGVVLIRAGSIPRTSSGKVQRGRCKQDYLTGKLAVVSEWDATTARQGEGKAPRNPIEEMVAILWAQALGLNVVAIDDALLDLGGDSLAALRIIGSVFDVFKVQLTLEDLFRNPTVAALAARIEELQGSANRELSAEPVDQSIAPLSVEQYPVWMMEQLFPGTAAYVIPVVFRMMGPLNTEVFEKSVQAVVERHHALRYSIDDRTGVPVQVRSAHPISLSVVDVSRKPGGGEPVAEQLIDEEVRRPFDLQRGPLARVTLFRLGPELHTCAFVMHHLVCDNESIRVLLRDLSALYNAFLRGRCPSLPELPTPLVRTQSIATGVRSVVQSRLNLGADRSAPVAPSFAGAAEGATLEAEVASGLQRIAREERVTFAMVMLASFSAFIHRYSGARTFVLGCPVSTRSRIEIENAVGLFAEIVPAVFAFEERITFHELVHQTRASMLAAWRSVSDSAEKAPRSEYQVLFSFLNQTQHALALDGIDAAIMPHTVRSSVADLCLSIMQSEKGVRCDFEYRTELFDTASIKLMFAKYLLLLNALVAEPAKPIADCDFLLSEERALSTLLPLEVTL